MRGTTADHSTKEVLSDYQQSVLDHLHEIAGLLAEAIVQLEAIEANTRKGKK